MAILDKETLYALIGNWAYRMHTEDIHEFIPEIFEESADLFNAVKNGADLSKLAIDRLIGWSELKDFSDYAEERYYPTARHKGLKAQQDLYIKKLSSDPNGKDALELYKKIQDMQLLIDGQSIEPETTNLLEDYWKDAEEIKNSDKAKYGLEDIDFVTGGIHRKDLIILAARPSDGKSAFALQTMERVRKSGYKVLYFPLEMSATQNVKRLVLMNEIASPGEVKTGIYTPEHKSAVDKYIQELQDDKNIKIYEYLNSLESIVNKIKSEKPYLTIIDQLSLMRPSGRYKDTREMFNLITSELKHTALKENTAIILLCQLKRGTDLKFPSIDDIGESDHISQDADAVLLLTPLSDDDSNKPRREVQLTVAKQRQGARGKQIKLMFEGEKYKFSNSVYNGFTRIDNNRGKKNIPSGAIDF